MKKNHRALRRGGYLAATTAVVIAIVIFLNLIVGQLPSHVREFDLSDNKIYTVSDTSKEFLAGLDKDVEIVVLAEANTMDERISKFLDRYAALSGRIKVTEVDPVAHPSAAESYGAASDSLVVRCADTGKSRTISFNDMITYDQSYYYMYGQQYETGFDVEGQLTSALDYVTGDTGKTVYALSNHGESELASQVKSAIEKSNFTLSSVSLLLNGGVPDDCDLLLSYGATKDLTADELTLLQTYLNGGGRLMFLPGQTEEKLPNWETLLESYGLRLADGYVADTQRYYQQLGSMYAIAPVFSSESSITSAFSDKDLTLMLNARGMQQLDTLPENVTVTPFLETSSGGVAVTADGAQTPGTYLLGAVAEKAGADGSTGRLTIISSASLVDEQILNTIPNGVNLDVFTNSLLNGFDDVSNISIPAKSLEPTYNTVRNAGLWSLLFVAVIPLAALVIGLVYWMRRRKL